MENKIGSSEIVNTPIDFIVISPVVRQCQATHVKKEIEHKKINVFGKFIFLILLSFFIFHCYAIRFYRFIAIINR